MRSNEFHGKGSIRYNGTERICSRLGDRSTYIYTGRNARLDSRTAELEYQFQRGMQELISDWMEVHTPHISSISRLQSTGSSTDIFYYHTNHLGSTAFVTDNNATVTQGFLYAPFGEIIDEYNATFANGIIPKYTFNAKELDEETGMYYYEARYYAPPVFTSRDPHFERYFWTSPYGYCSNNPLKYVDPTGMDDYEVNRKTGEITLYKKTEDNFDRLVAQGKDGLIKLKRNGKYKNSIEVDKNIVDENHRTSEYVESDNRIRQEMNFGTDEKSAKSVFIFLSRNTDVEWGATGYRKNGVDYNYVGTSGSPEFEAQISTRAQGKNISVSYYYHYHPGKNATTEPSTGRPDEVGNDVNVWNNIWGNSPSAEMGIVATGLPLRKYEKCPTSKNGYRMKQ